MKLIRLQIIPLLVLIFAACSSKIGVALMVSDEADRDLVNTLTQSPLPADYSFSDADAKKSHFTVVIGTSDWANRAVDFIPGYMLHREWYSPVVAIDSDVFDTEFLPADRPATIVPLAEIIPPVRGIPDHGLYPGDPDYPWYKDTLVWIEDSEGTPIFVDDIDVPEAALPLIEWIQLVPSRTDPVNILWIAGVGDLMPGRGVGRMLSTPDGLTSVFTDTLAVLQNADLLLGNLEGAVTTGGAVAKKSYTFKFHPRILAQLNHAGFDYLSLTNNHSFDYGEIGFLDTLRHFQESKIHTSGAGTDLTEASKPAILHVGEHEIRILSVGAYPRERNGFDGEAIASALDNRPGILWHGDASAAAVTSGFTESSFDILMIHGGDEWSEAPSEDVRDLFRGYVDLGADLILGSHPHVVHGIESYSGKIIAYSLGNFIFPGMEETRYGEESIIVRVGLHKNAVKYMDLVPVNINGKIVSIDRSGRILDRVTAQSGSLSH